MPAPAGGLFADHKPRRPVQPVPAAVNVQQRVCAELEEVAAIFETKLAHNAFEFVQVIKTDAGGAFSATVACSVCRSRFHNDFDTSKAHLFAVSR